MINKIIRERRSIFPVEYTGQKISDNIIPVLIENAHYAPNHKSNFPWRFIILKDETLYQWIDLAADIFKKSEKFKEDKYNKILNNKNLISHAIAIVRYEDPVHKTIEIEDICAVACAVQNMYLTLSQFDNIGAYWSTGLGTNNHEVHSFLKLEKNHHLMGFFILGHVINKRTSLVKKDFNNYFSYL